MLSSPRIYTSLQSPHIVSSPMRLVAVLAFLCAIILHLLCVSERKLSICIDVLSAVFHPTFARDSVLLLSVRCHRGRCAVHSKWRWNAGVLSVWMQWFVCFEGCRAVAVCKVWREWQLELWGLWTLAGKPQTWNWQWGWTAECRTWCRSSWASRWTSSSSSSWSWIRYLTWRWCASPCYSICQLHRQLVIQGIVLFLLGLWTD